MTTKMNVHIFLGVFMVAMGIIMANTGLQYTSMVEASVLTYALGIIAILIGGWLLAQEESDR